MPFSIITSGQYLLSFHVSLNKNEEGEHLLSAFLRKQAQWYAFPMNYPIQPPHANVLCGGLIYSHYSR